MNGEEAFGKLADSDLPAGEAVTPGAPVAAGARPS